MIGRPRDDRRWQDPPPRESLELASDLTRRAGLALDNARLYERQRATVRALQHSLLPPELLPPELPDIPRAELAAGYEAAGEANEVGGDFYDVFGVNDAGGPGGSRWRFAIGDVCGTGPEAAAVTGLARHTLRILAAEGHPIADVMRRLNKLILGEGSGRFVTLRGQRVRPGTARRRHGRPGDPRYRRLSLASHPASRIIAAATPNERIDADIQLAGVKPMSCPKDVHAEAHQDTYPGLMSW